MLRRLLPVALRTYLRRVRFRLRAQVGLLRVFYYDFRRYRAASSLGYKYREREQLRSRLAIDIHKLEKGMALAQPRPGFGSDTIRRLTGDTSRYKDLYGEDDTTDWAVAALQAYCAYHKDLDVDITWVVEATERLLSQTKRDIPEEAGGIFEAGVPPSQFESFATFARSRRSARIFTQGAVDAEKLYRAAAVAQTAPSVCNRQSGRIHLFRKPAVKQALLAAQGGSRGFGETADVVAVITSDRRSFQTAQERNQCWVDGGLFAMTFLYGLHDEGLGSCCLNWSRGVDDDLAARRAGNIPDHEAIILMIAIGNVPGKIRIARSPRRPLFSALPTSG